MVRTDNFWSRLAGAGRAVWFYFYKEIWPANLIPVYPLWHIDAADALSYLPGILLDRFLFHFFWIYRRGWGRMFLFGLGYTVLMRSPVLGSTFIFPLLTGGLIIGSISVIVILMALVSAVFRRW